MEELIKYLSEKLDVDVSKISATSHLIDDLDSDDWTNLEVIIEVGEKFNRPITDEEADGIETVSALVITSEPAAATTLSRLNFFIF